MRYPSADLHSSYSPDGRTLTMGITCPHHATEADFLFLSSEGAIAAYAAAVESVARTHEERFHCGCAKVSFLADRPN